MVSGQNIRIHLLLFLLFDVNFRQSKVGSWKNHTFYVTHTHTHTHLRLLNNKDSRKCACVYVCMCNVKSEIFP